MAISRRDLSKEIHYYVNKYYDDAGSAIMQQDIVKKFTAKYSVSATTVVRCLNELVNSKSPFRIHAFYNNGRYYMPSTVPLFWNMCIALSMAIPIVSLFLIGLRIVTFVLLFPFTIVGVVCFWFGVSVYAVYSSKRNQKKIKVE